MKNIAALSADDFYVGAYYNGDTTWMSPTLRVEFKTNK